jgi:pimeloyl-ACP methyl ester carboxylesterase
MKLCRRLAPRRHVDLTGRIVAMTQRLGREVFLRQNSLEREDGEAALRALRVPLVIICGEHDDRSPRWPASRHEMAR